MVLLPKLTTADASDEEKLRRLTVFGDAYLALSPEESASGPTDAQKEGLLADKGTVLGALRVVRTPSRARRRPDEGWTIHHLPLVLQQLVTRATAKGWVVLQPLLEIINHDVRIKKWHNIVWWVQ